MSYLTEHGFETGHINKVYFDAKDVGDIQKIRVRSYIIYNNNLNIYNKLLIQLTYNYFTINLQLTYN